MTRQLGTGWFASIAAAVLLAAGFGLAADQAFAAKVKNKGDHKVKAQIKHGTLVVEGTPDDDQIVLRLRSGDPTRLEVVTRTVSSVTTSAATGSTRSSSTRAKATTASLIDESNGVFTDAETTTFDGGAGNDELLGGRGNETFDGGPGNDSVDGNQGAMPRSSVPATTASPGIQVMEATWSRVRTVSTRWSSTALPGTRSSRLRTTAGGCASRATSATS